MNNSAVKHISAFFNYGGKIKLDTGWNSKNVICPDSKLFYILDGEIAVEIDGNEIIAKKGDMMLIPAECKHSFYLTNKGYAEKYWMHFSLKRGKDDFFALNNFPYLINNAPKDRVVGLFELLLSNVNGESVASSLTVTSAVINLVSVYAENCIVTRKKQAGDEIERIIDYVKSNYGENPTLPTLTKMANLSQSHFVRKFKERTGYPPMQYVAVIKMETAKFLLMNTSDSIGKVMESVGFYDSAHFSKTFKQMVGYSPKAYREIYGKFPFSTHKVSQSKK
ncbi:MAG: helix-turn-helix domain-containing protein [Clostridiales bacterium]|nr:helix-turn-helix domain-containing protein [Clostridiales bacterium]